MLFSFVLGPFLNPQLWLPYAFGGSVHGLARLLGKYSGDLAVNSFFEYVIFKAFNFVSIVASSEFVCFLISLIVNAK